MYKKISGLVVSLTAVFACAAWAEVPAGYPADYQKTIDAAVKEGKVVVYSTTDTKAAGPLIKGFEAQYPGVKVEYNDMNSTELYNRYISEQAAGGGSGDVVWSSSMDTALKLATTEYAEQYASPEVKQLPDWAVWQQKAYGTTYEPVVFIYNKRLIRRMRYRIRIPRWQNLSPARPINLKAKSPPTISKNRASALCWRYRTARPTRTILPTWRISPKAA